MSARKRNFFLFIIVCVGVVYSSYKVISNLNTSAIFEDLRNLVMQVVPGKNKPAETAQESSSTVTPTPLPNTAVITHNDDAFYDSEVALFTTPETTQSLKVILKHFIKFRDEVFPQWNTLYWDRNNDYVFGHITKMDVVNKTFNFQVAAPDDKDFSLVLGRSVTTTCDETNTVLVADALDVLKVGINIWDTVKSDGFSLFSYCLDDSCSSVGKECILINDVPFVQVTQ